MKQYWVKYRFVKHNHTEQNPFEQDMASWKFDITKLIIDYDEDPKVWFKVMQNINDFHNHQANKRNEDNFTPLTAQKGILETSLN